MRRRQVAALLDRLLNVLKENIVQQDYSKEEWKHLGQSITLIVESMKDLGMVEGHRRRSLEVGLPDEDFKGLEIF